jgi:ferredoxin
MTILYFSATGNSLDAAKHIGGNGCTLLSIPKLMREKRFEFADDVIGLVCPIYYFGVPKMVTRFLKEASLNAEYCFAVLTYGGNQMATAYNLQRLMKRRGRRFDYTATVSTVSNYLPGYDMTDIQRKLAAKNVPAQVSAIAEDINGRKTNAATATLKHRIVWHIAQIMAKKAMHKNTAKKYMVGDGCTKCGVCAKVCPADNITIADKVEFGGKCEACLACIQLCPQTAIRLKHESGSARYRNPNVTLSEIIAANCAEH